MKPGHDQSGHRLRMEWGPTGATAVAADVTVVVDILSFTTTVTIAVDRGMTVLPLAWRDDRAVAEAAFRAVRPRIGTELAACAGGIELDAAGFAADVEVAGQLDVTSVVPVLREEAFVRG